MNTDSELLGSGPPYCQGCKWPLNSKVAKTCGCLGFDEAAHNVVLQQARQAQARKGPKQ